MGANGVCQFFNVKRFVQLNFSADVVSFSVFENSSFKSLTRPSTVGVRTLSRSISFALLRHVLAWLTPWRYGLNCRYSAKFVENSSPEA